MALKNTPIRRKLIAMTLLTTGLVLLLTCTAFLAYEFLTFRQTAVRQFSTLGEIISSNSTAALAFENPSDAGEILSALKAEPHVVAAALYDGEGRLFSVYPDSLPSEAVPAAPGRDGYRFERGHLVGFEPVVQGGNTRLGTLFLTADMGAMSDRLRLYGVIAVLVIGVSFLVAYLLSRKLQQQISVPILALAETAKAVSDRRDYSVRATKLGRDELGLLTDAFNHMLQRIDEQNQEERRTEAMRVKSLQLEAQNVQIQEASRLKSEFLANMSHELRTPLNAIIGFSELIHDGKVGPIAPKQQEYLADILTSSRHLLQLINDVLDLSKVEAGKLDFHPEPVDLSRLVGEVLGILRTAIASKAIHVESHVDPSLGDVVLDAARFKQVLYNYVSNALKFTPEGGRVIVRALPEPVSSAFRLEVEDTGIGIAPEDIARLFVEFRQLDAGAAKQHSGTGLGLALTKKLVETQGGTIGVRSTPGRGSVFHAVFPRQPLKGASIVAPHATGAEGAPEEAPALLVIEDDARDQATLVRTLTEAGYKVDVAATGAQALAKCRERAYDAITLDLLLPDMSGLDVLQAIHSDGAHRDVPIIVITVVTEKESVAGFVVHDLLPKPLDSSALLASLSRAGVRPDRAGAVMVVDDDPGSLKLMSATLAQLGYRAHCVGTGDEGVRAARQSPPLAVVLDLMMPGMDGFEFLDRFRQVPLCRRVPVIVWTVKDLTAAEALRLRTSAQGVVAKGRDESSTIMDELQVFLPNPRNPMVTG